MALYRSTVTGEFLYYILLTCRIPLRHIYFCVLKVSEFGFHTNLCLISH